MDLNDYTLMLLLQDRLTEMVAAAQRHALLRETTDHGVRFGPCWAPH